MHITARFGAGAYAAIYEADWPVEAVVEAIYEAYPLHEALEALRAMDASTDTEGVNTATLHLKPEPGDPNVTLDPYISKRKRLLMLIDPRGVAMAERQAFEEARAARREARTARLKEKGGNTYGGHPQGPQEASGAEETKLPAE